MPRPGVSPLRGLRGKAIGYRRLQALLIAALAAVITACAVLAPLYDRAIQEAYAHRLLNSGDPSSSGITVSSPMRDAEALERGPSRPLSFADLAEALPGSVRRSLAAPVRQQSARTVLAGDGADRSTTTGDLTYRSGACAHLRVASGRCPTKPNEALVSTADARLFHLHLGQRLVALDVPLLPQDAKPPSVPLTVVGVYRFVPGPYWFSRTVVGQAGTVQQDAAGLVHDTWFVDASEFTAADAPAWQQDASSLDYAALGTIGPDRLLALARSVQRLQDRGAGAAFADDPAGAIDPDRAVLTSGLPDLGRDLSHGRSQGRRVVPLLMVQLGLLAALVLWLVLGAATEQRRPEIALSRLRGYGVRGARRLLLAELTPVVLAGAIVGCLVALGLDALVRRLLPGPTPFSPRPALGYAVVAAVVVLVVLVRVAAVGAARQGVDELLRRVPARRTGLALGAVDAIVVTAAGTAGVIFLTGGLRGPLAFAAPTLLAVVVGLVLAHLAVPVAARAGRALLARGRYVDAVAVLATARRPATRRIVAIVTVASSLLVFSAEAVRLGSENRQRAAEQLVGAPMSVPVDGVDTLTVLRALDGLHEPDVTPVVTTQTVGGDTLQTLAVRPAEARRIGWFDDPAFRGVRWSALAAPTRTPLTLRGDSLILPVVSRGTVAAHLTLRVLDHNGDADPVDLGTVPAQGRRVLRADAPCFSSCRVIGLQLTVRPGETGGGRVTLGVPTVKGGTTTLPGKPADWGSLRSKPGDVMTVGRSGGSTVVDFTSAAVNTLSIGTTWAPLRAPALVVDHHRRLPRAVQSGGIDGRQLILEPAGRMPRVPASQGPAALTNLDVLLRQGGRTDPNTQLSLWFAHEHGPDLARVRRALAAEGVQLGVPVRTSAVRQDYDRTIPAWALQLGLLVGVVGLLLAALVLVVVAATTWRGRARELATLRMSGVPVSAVRRISAREQLSVVVLAVLAGSACGVLSAHVALPSVPLFAAKPAVSTLDLSTPWLLVAAVVAGTVGLLAVVAVAVGRAVAARAAYQRVRESV